MTSQTLKGWYLSKSIESDLQIHTLHLFPYTYINRTVKVDCTI